MPEKEPRFHAGERVVFFADVEDFRSSYGNNVGTVEVVEEDEGVFTYIVIFGDGTAISAEEGELASLEKLERQ